MDWSGLLYVLGAVLLVWVGLRFIRNNPLAFSKINLSKSITTLGFLALFLIFVVIIFVLILKNI